jgi:carboxypeptidase C (cathepsin A)
VDIYDRDAKVDSYLNLDTVKEAMGAHPGVKYVSCSKVVGDKMAADTMQSVRHLLPDVLEHMPVLLYQGQYDIFDGPASSISWINTLDWTGWQALLDDPGKLWWHKDVVAGWIRRAGNLAQIVVHRAGHMVPHDQPTATKDMVNTWIKSVLSS